MVKWQLASFEIGNDNDILLVKLKERDASL